MRHGVPKLSSTHQDLITKTKLAMDFNDRLQKTAGIQDEAERKSTVNGNS
jgi:hypothetical protein